MPEGSRGFEASLRYRGERFQASLTGYRQRLRDEIVDVFNLATFTSTTTNRAERSHRGGVEAEAGWQIAPAMRLTGHYAFLAATEPGIALDLRTREVRRPRHSGSLAVDGALGRWSYGATLAYAGARRDMNFDAFPTRNVRLAPYWLAGARAAYRLRDAIEMFARVANAFDADYQDVFGYRTEGRSLHAGVRLAARR